MPSRTLWTNICMLIAWPPTQTLTMVNSLTCTQRNQCSLYISSQKEGFIYTGLIRLYFQRKILLLPPIHHIQYMLQFWGNPPSCISRYTTWPNVSGHLTFIPCCIIRYRYYNNLYSSERLFHLIFEHGCKDLCSLSQWGQALLFRQPAVQFIPNVFNRVEVRDLCRLLEFFYLNFSKPCLYVYSIQSHSIQLCASKFGEGWHVRCPQTFGRIVYKHLLVYLFIFKQKLKSFPMQFIKYSAANLT